MSDATRPFRPRRGTIWREFQAGDPVGKQFAEWAYITTQFPEGIAATELKRADPSVQVETATVWFEGNFIRYDLSTERWFTFREAGGTAQAPLAGSNPFARI
jgi:hypothetical protein